MNKWEEVIMLVTFSCPAYADITMFGEVAVRLLKLMGHSGTVRGALLAEDVPAALARLQPAISSASRSCMREFRIIDSEQTMAIFGVI